MGNPLWDQVAKQGLLGSGNYIKNNTRGALLILQAAVKIGGFRGNSAIVKFKVIESASKGVGFPAHEAGDKANLVKNMSGDAKKVMMAQKTLNSLIVAAVSGDPECKTMPNENELTEILDATFATQDDKKEWVPGAQFLRGFIVKYDTILKQTAGQPDKYFPSFEMAQGANTPDAVAKRRAELDKTDPLTFD